MEKPITPLKIIKQKLTRGGQVNGGELRLIMKDLLDNFEHLENQVNELTKKLNAKPRRGSGGTKDDRPSSDV
jgi:molybdenum-dependent DNA-binding transcriptional regulator ModE